MSRNKLLVILLTALFLTFPLIGQETEVPVEAPVEKPDPEAEIETPEAESAESEEKIPDITDRELEKKLELMATVLDIVSKHYVEGVNRGDLVEGAIRGIMAELDPHSNFLTKEHMQEMQIDLHGELMGIGVYITLDENDILTVITPIEGTPAYRIGLLAGDKILEIDGQSTRGFTLNKAVKLIRGEKGTTVRLTVYHVDLKEQEVLDIERAAIPITSVKETKMADETHNIGYLRLSTFHSNSRDEMETGVKELLGQGMKGLVFDLRDNGGGLLTSAIEIADMFLKEGVIVSVKGRDGSDLLPPARANNKTAYTDFPIVILINGYSASASEIVSAALRDNHRAILLGEKTFGKGSVQKLISLEDGSGIKLTIQRYYTPAGISIDKKGIKPDVEEVMNIETKLGVLKQRRQEEIERNKNPEKINGNGADDIEKEGEVKSETEDVIEMINEKEADGDKEAKVFVDTQLQRAIDVLIGYQVLSEKMGVKAAPE